MPEASGVNRERPPGFGPGFAAPFRGLAKWLGHARLLAAGLPALGVGLALWAAILVVWISWFASLRQWLASAGAHPGQALDEQWWALSPAVFLGGAGLSVLLVLTLGNLLTAPWQRTLGSRAEDLLEPDPDRRPPARPQQGTEAMLAELKRLGSLPAWLLPCVLLWLVPLAGGLLASAWILVTLVLFLATLFTGPVLRRRGLTGWARTRFVWRHRKALIGFGLGLTLLALIPLLQLACLPAAVVGGVLLVQDLRRAE